MSKYYVVAYTSMFDLEIRSSHDSLEKARSRAKEKENITGRSHDVVKFMGLQPGGNN